MAIAFVKSASTTSAGYALSVSVTAPAGGFAQGNFLVIGISYHADGGTSYITDVTCTDTDGVNVYTKRHAFFYFYSDPTFRVISMVWTTQITQAIAAGETITFSFNALDLVRNFRVRASEFSGTNTYLSAQTVTGEAITTAVDIGSGVAPSGEELRIGWLNGVHFGLGGGNAFTPDAGWTGITQLVSDNGVDTYQSDFVYGIFTSGTPHFGGDFGAAPATYWGGISLAFNFVPPQPIALPSGYVDTGIRKTVIMEADVRVRMSGGGGAFGGPAVDPFTDGVTTNIVNFHGPASTLSTWDLCGVAYTAQDPVTCTAPMDYVRSCQVWAQGPGVSPTRLAPNQENFCLPDLDAVDMPYSDWYHWRGSYGPYRLGVKVSLLAAHAADVPNFASHYEMTYAWFADQFTTLQETLGSLNSGLLYWQGAGTGSWGSLQYPSAFSEAATSFQLTISGLLLSAGVREVEYQNIKIDGRPIPLAALSGGVITGTGDGSANGQHTGGTGSFSHSAIAPYVFTEDIDLKRAGTEESLPVDVLDADSTAHVTPYSKDYEQWTASWITNLYGAGRTITINEADTTRFPANDTKVLLWGANALQSPNTAEQYYQPVSVEIEEILDVMRPDGAQPSFFVSDDAAQLIVNDLASGPEVDVKQIGHYIRRVFGVTGTNLPIWRRWLGVGTSGKADALFNPDLAEQTEHPAGTDIFDWNTYRYIRLGFQSFTGEYPELTFTVEGVHVVIDDTHVTGSQRNTDFTVTETAYTRTYTWQPNAGSGLGDDIDLLFPDEGGPFYHGRVDAVKFSGWPVGRFKINMMKLPSKDSATSHASPGTAYLKVGFGAPVQRGDYSALGLAHNGSWTWGNLGDQDNKENETGQTGGNLRYIYILTGYPSGIIQDSQYSLESFWELADAVEGWTVTYDATKFTAVNTDTFGVSLAPEIAQWSRRCNDGFPLNEIYKPKCHPHVSKITVATLQPTKIYTREWVDGIVESIVSDGFEPAGANQTVTLGSRTAFTDSFSYAQVLGVPTGTTVPSGTPFALKPRDKPRISTLIESPKRWPYNAQTQWQFFARVNVDDGVFYRGSEFTTPPFSITTQVTSSDLDERPVILRTALDHWILLWARRGVGVYEARSYDDGRTWGDVTLPFEGGKNPLVISDPMSYVILRAALVGSTIVGTLQAPGDATPGTQFNFVQVGGAAMSFADDTFGLAFAYDGQARVVGSFHLSDSSSITEWESFDDGRTWRQL